MVQLLQHLVKVVPVQTAMKAYIASEDRYYLLLSCPTLTSTSSCQCARVAAVPRSPGSGAKHEADDS